MATDTERKTKEMKEKVERVKKATYEILQGQNYMSSKEVSDRCDISHGSAAQILRHNFYKWDLLKAYDTNPCNLIVFYVREDAKELPSFIKIETTQEQLKEIRAKHLERLKARVKHNNKRVYEIKRVTPELVDKAMEDLIKEKGKFNLSELKKELNRKEKVGKDSIRMGMNVILDQYSLRITPGKERRYEFKDGYALASSI